MNEERWRGRHRIDSIESNFESRSDIFVCLFVEADMAVADLEKAKVSRRQRLTRLRNLCQSFRREYAAADRPKQAGTGPCHAMEKAAAINAVMFVVVRNVVRHNFFFRLTNWYLFYICPYRSGSRLFQKILEVRCGTRNICKNAALRCWPGARRLNSVK